MPVKAKYAVIKPMTMNITPEIASILDYSKGFGHSDLVRVTQNDLAEYVESRRHHWAGYRAA